MTHKSIIHRAGDLFVAHADSQRPDNTPMVPVVPNKPQGLLEYEEALRALRERVIAAGRVA